MTQNKQKITKQRNIAFIAVQGQGETFTGTNLCPSLFETFKYTLKIYYIHRRVDTFMVQCI